MKKLIFSAFLIAMAVTFSCKKEDPVQNELKSSKLTRPWVRCANGHYTIGDCGVVFSPPYYKCPTCGAVIVDSGNEVCGEG